MKWKKRTDKCRTGFACRAGKLLFVLGLPLMMGVSAYAQSQSDPPPDDPGPDPDLPFDGGVSLLVAAGVAYGAKHWADARKEKKAVDQEQNG